MAGIHQFIFLANLCFTLQIKKNQQFTFKFSHKKPKKKTNSGGLDLFGY